MSPITALGTTDFNEELAFSILKNVLTPPDNIGLSSIFRATSTKQLPYNTTIPVYKTTHSVPKPNHTTIALLESVRHSDTHSYFHTINHGAHSYNFAYFLGLNEQETIDVYYASLLHDIGKIFYKDIVVLPRSLSIDEQVQLQKHTITSFVLLTACGYTDTIAYSGLFHHLSYDHTFGYPLITDHLYKQIEQISYELKVPQPAKPLLDFKAISQKTWDIIHAVTLMDSLDASIDPHRPYKKPIPFKDVLSNFETAATNWKTMYDPSMKPAFEEYIEWLNGWLTGND